MAPVSEDISTFASFCRLVLRAFSARDAYSRIFLCSSVCVADGMPWGEAESAAHLGVDEAAAGRLIVDVAFAFFASAFDYLASSRCNIFSFKLNL